MDVIHGRVAGLDVHKETIVACVRIMAGGKATRECRTFDSTTSGLQALLSWLTESRCTLVAMEATGVYWKPVWNILRYRRVGARMVFAGIVHKSAISERKGA
jgi:transposase